VLLDDDDDSSDCLPNAKVNHGYDVEAPSFRSNFIYTTDQKWTVSLLKILYIANAPDYVFGDILEWGRSHQPRIILSAQWVVSHIPRMLIP